MTREIAKCRPRGKGKSFMNERRFDVDARRIMLGKVGGCGSAGKRQLTVRPVSLGEESERKHASRRFAIAKEGNERVQVEGDSNDDTGMKEVHAVVG